MDDRSSKLYFGFCMLVLIWIGVYWAWEPDKSTNPKISIAQPHQPIQQTPEPTSQPTPTAPEPTTPESQPQEQQTLTLIPPSSKPTLIPPQFTTHTIKQGQVMQDIAQIYYGQSKMWHVIARANPTVDPLKLRAGRTLRIPKDPNNIQGLVQSPNNSTTTQAPNPQNQTVEYLVQPGDSLSKIAQNYYGSARHADFIYQSNRKTLRSKDAIRVGQTLKLPPLNPNTDP